MGLIKNAINFGNGFNIGAVAPIDSRMRVELLSDLTTVWTAAIPAYKGMVVTVMETSDVYVLKDVDNYTNIDSWVKLGSASAAADGAADALTQAKAYTDQEVKELADGAVNTNTDAIAILKGDAETDGSVAKAVADAKKELLGDAAEGYKTFGELEEKIIASAAELADVQEDVDKFFKDASFAENAKDTLKELQEYITSDAEGALAMSEAIADNKTAIATLNGDAKTDGSVAKAIADAKTAETTARNQAIESAKSELEGKIDKKSEIVDVTNLFKSSGETLSGYTMQQLANSHLVYKYTDSSSLGGASSVQVTMVAGSPSNSAMVIDGTTTIPTFGSYCTLIFEIYSEQNGKYILTQYLARVKLSDDISSNNKWITESVEQHILATQESIDTLSTKVDTEQTRAKAAEKANAAAIANEKTRAEAAESGLTAAIANEISAREAAITAETSAREAEIARTKTELEEKINNKSEIVDVTNLFTNGGQLSGYTMQELANSHLVYQINNSGSIVTPSVQVTMVAGSAGNSTVVIDDTTKMPTFGSHYTLIFEIYSEGILTQYLARVGLAGLESDVWTTNSVEKHILATQESINTLSTALDQKQGIISDLANIRSGAIKGATAVQSIDVTNLFANGGELSGYTLVDLTKNKLYHDNGNTVKCVGYGNSAINPNTNEANLVMESFEGAVREIAIAHIKANGTTLTTDSVKTYSSNVFVMRVSQVDYDTMKAAGTLDENTLYVIAEITE